MSSTNRNAAAEARGVPETDQLGGKVNRENSLASTSVQDQLGRRLLRAKGGLASTRQMETAPTRWCSCFAGLGSVAGKGAPMTGRNRLPNHASFEIDLEGLRYSATVGRFPDGAIGELFLSSQKSDSSANTGARDCGILLSLALRHVADLETIRRALSRDSQGRESGPAGAALAIIMGRTA